APDMSLYTPLDLNTMPALVKPARYFAATDQYGSPVRPATVDTLTQMPAEAVNLAMRNMFGAAFTASSDSKRSAQGLQCTRTESALVSGTEFLVPDGASIMIRSSTDITASLFLWFQGPVASGPLLRVSLIASMPVW